MDDLKKLCGLKPGGESAAGHGRGGDEIGTLDDVLRRHEQFQDLCLKECLLTNIGLLKVMTFAGARIVALEGVTQIEYAIA